MDDLPVDDDAGSPVVAETPEDPVLPELAEGGDEDDEHDEDAAPRHNALPRRLESWRSRTATGAVMSAIAMGLHQVFHKEQEKPAIVQEAPSDPYGDDDPVIVDYVADDANATTVTLRPWLMPKTDEEGGA